MDNLKEAILKKRPNLADSSVVTYLSSLSNIYKNVFPNMNLQIKKFDTDYDKILKYLSDLPAGSRKSRLSALYILTENVHYKNKMMEDISEYKKDVSNQTKTESDKSNWVNDNTIDALLTKLKTKALFLFKQPVLSMKDIQEIQNYILVLLYSGVIPLRRSKDFTAFKIKNIDKDKDNYMEKSSFFFNCYKTAKYYGKQEISLPPLFKKTILKWITINPTQYLLFDNQYQQLNSVKITQRLNKLFQKKTAVNALRHSFLSNKYANTIETNKELAIDLTNMGSSLSQATTYIKQ